MAATRSPERTVVSAHFGSVSVFDATYLGLVLRAPTRGGRQFHDRSTLLAGFVVVRFDRTKRKSASARFFVPLLGVNQVIVQHYCARIIFLCLFSYNLLRYV